MDGSYCLDIVILTFCILRELKLIFNLHKTFTVTNMH